VVEPLGPDDEDEVCVEGVSVTATWSPSVSGKIVLRKRSTSDHKIF